MKEGQNIGITTKIQGDTSKHWNNSWNQGVQYI